MDNGTKLKLGMLTRVLEFSRAYPSDDPEVKAVVGQLEGLLTRARSLEQRVIASRAEVQASAWSMAASRQAIYEKVQRLVEVREKVRGQREEGEQ